LQSPPADRRHGEHVHLFQVSPASLPSFTLTVLQGLFGKKEMRILMVGLDAAGKATKVIAKGDKKKTKGKRKDSYAIDIFKVSIWHLFYIA
jgi:hypothetical protein